MKILSVVHGFPPDQMAGAEIYAWNLARELQARGEQVVVLAPGDRAGRAEHEIVEEEVDGLRVLRLVNRYGKVHELADTYAHPEIEARYDAVLAREKPDLVHVHHTIGTTANSTLLARRRGIPVVITLHDFWFHCARGQRITPRGHLCTEVQPWRCALCVGKKRARYHLDWSKAFLGGDARDARGKSALRRLLEFLPRFLVRGAREAGAAPIRRRLEVMDRALREASLILAPSEFILREYVRRGAPAERTVFSEYGMDASRFEGFERPPRPADAPLRFGFVGTLLRTKGIELLISAFQRVPEGVATLEVHGAAAGPDPEGYERRLRAANRHPGLAFRGRFDNRRIAEILGSFDVLVIPSLWWENAPLTIHEAVLARMPVITSGHGGMEEMVARYGCGVTFTPGDAGALAEAMMRFVEEPALLEALGRARRPVRGVADDVDGLLERFRRLVAGP